MGLQPSIINLYKKDKTFARPKLKSVANGQINVAERVKFVMERVKNILGI